MEHGIWVRPSSPLEPEGWLMNTMDKPYIFDDLERAEDLASRYNSTFGHRDSYYYVREFNLELDPRFQQPEQEQGLSISG